MPEAKWQLENAATGEWRTLTESELLDLFATGKLSFISKVDVACSAAHKLSGKLERDISAYPSELVALAQVRVQYLKELDRRQPMAISRRTIEPLIGTPSRNKSTMKNHPVGVRYAGTIANGCPRAGTYARSFSSMPNAATALLEWLRKSKRSATR
jgi:hypothetical protein